MKRCEKTFWTNVLINGLTSPEKKKKKKKKQKKQNKTKKETWFYRL